MASKSTLTNRESPFGKFELKDRRAVATRTSYVSVQYFHYEKQNFGIPTNCKTADEIEKIETTNQLKTITGTIEAEVLSMNVNKSIGQTAASFELQLTPSQNWKKILAPGDWIIIYMFDDFGTDDRTKDTASNKDIILIGNIDRVARVLSKDQESDKIQLRYQVSGRNFGKVFEDSDIWFDPYSVQVEFLDRVTLPSAGLNIQGSPDYLVQNLMNVFLGPGGIADNAKTSPLGNWKISPTFANVFKTLFLSPSNFAAESGLFGPGDVISMRNQDFAALSDFADSPDTKFYDIMKFAIDEKLPGFKARHVFTLESNGSLGDLMRSSCNSLVNELYFEEVRGPNGVFPTVVLKPRPVQTPFFEDTFGEEGGAAYLSTIGDNHQTLQDAANTNFVEVSQAEIKYENLGKDEHSRFNLFFFKDVKHVEDHLSIVANLSDKRGIANPLFLGASIERNGLKRMEQIFEFTMTSSISGNQEVVVGGPQVNLFKAFVAQLYDMNAYNHLYDAGTIECSGVLEAELGKVLVLKADPQFGGLDKIYYIEGYEHQWKFPGQWTTTFTVTHGQWKTIPGDKKIFIDATADDQGQDDVILNNAYIAKTFSGKK